MHELLKLMKERRSVRKFQAGQPLSEEQLAQILEAARWAPSAGNVQPWHFLVVKDDALKAKLVRAAWGQSFIAEAPVTIVVCADLRAAAANYAHRGQELYCLQDTAAAIQNLLLMAHALGLGSCWVGAFDENAASESLSLPHEWRPVALIPLGYPDETPSAPPRKSLHHVVKEIK